MIGIVKIENYRDEILNTVCNGKRGWHIQVKDFLLTPQQTQLHAALPSSSHSNTQTQIPYKILIVH